jgi:predicted ATPase/DNA-binding CsgD family transcriptional regulator
MLAVQRHAPAERCAEDDLGVASKQARVEDADSAGRGRAGWIRSVPRSHSSGEHNLPARLTSFVGRDRELAEVRGVLAEHRLVTLTGFGGVGKTRLALEVASGLLDDYLDGVRLVELAALSDPALLAQTVAAALELGEQPGRSIEAVLQATLQSCELLLVLDNCEHVVQACAELADRLLRACPDVRILATSREALGIPGEMIWPLAPLELPGDLAAADDVEQYGAVRLLVDRSRTRKPDFHVTDASRAAVIEICRQLDGIPLAIELAAAWIPTLTVDELATRLDSRFRLLTGGSRTAMPRHQTLRALVDWSYERLDEDERAVLRSLSVFAGGWTLAAAEAVMGHGSRVVGDGGNEVHSPSDVPQPLRGGNIGYADIPAPSTEHPQPDTLEVLGRLVAKSLVLVGEQQGTTRYSFLETIRQYAVERLSGGESAAARRRHAEYFAELAEQAEPNLRGAEQQAWLLRLTTEHDNVRAALRWSIQEQEVETALRLCGALWRFWWVHGHLDEGARWLRQALDLPGEGPDVPRAATLNGAGALARLRGEYAASTAYHTEALAMLERIGDRAAIAATYQNLASVAKDRQSLAEAETLYERSLALFREIGDGWGTAMALNNLGIAMRSLRQYDRATALCQEALTIRRSRGDLGGISQSLMELARIARARRDHERAAELVFECLPIVQQLGVPMHVAAGLEVIAWVAGARSEHTRAARLFGAADALRQAIGAPVPVFERTDHESALNATRTALGPARYAAALAEGQALSADDAVKVALTGEAAPKARSNGPTLSRREREVVVLLARGLSNRQLADALVVSQLTAASHVRNILRKLGLDRRGQVAVWAAEHGVSDG